MDDIKHKLTVLARIAEEFNHKDVTWAVGASLLLYFKGITSEFHDIDIMIAEEDVETVKDTLLSLGDIQQPNPNAKYKTKCFLEFHVDDVDIDAMAGFVIVNQDKEYYFPLKKENIKDFTEVHGIKIPLQSVDEWRNYYELMGRNEKVKMIDTYADSH
ncbi:hypothetical protein SAMN05443270_0681 [Lacrimispora sphenoides]|jgi:hypothetical protein|uniref:nucleotidyltransferase domain-containing protein n=1 Tax=Lacrimispora sphenoides TaxID=29370 RepID=UPI0008AF0472|nr:hypothetical protein [Lacrimispora sphenoides]SET61204.1 hypothetical protein SAMN05443270_0681 [Lacrimispora sphenoides]